MAEKIVWVKFAEMGNFIKEVFEKVGMSREDAEVCSDVLITADKMGIDSHGVNRLKPIYYDRIKEERINVKSKFEIVREGLTTAVVDGHNSMGQVISKKAMQLTIDKAKKYGMGMVAVRNSNHYGIAGYYTLMAANNNMIGITGTNARPSIAPTFGIENMLGTNPITFSLPTDEEFPFFLDCATSITQRGKIEVYARTNQKVPEGWVINENGESETDAKLILKKLTDGTASLLPLGGLDAGYKGYGYATAVEILSSALQGGGFMKALSGFSATGAKIPFSLGHFFMAIDISAFTEIESFKKITGDILRELRNSKKMPGEEKIYTAGEKEYLTWLERKDKGVPINAELQTEIKTIQSELNLTKYDFKF
jgi:L-2-hydroxycarboxylate dehydrogenase (NAD+)